MSLAKLTSSALAFSVAVGSAVFLGMPQAHAAPPEQNKQDSAAATCVFDKYAPTLATPYKADNVIDFGSYSSLGGAQLFVPAREGLTKEWLAASVQQVMARAQAQSPKEAASDPASCDSPQVKNVSVRVVSGKTGYWVQLISPDQRSSEALLKWARTLTDHHKLPAQAR